MWNARIKTNNNNNKLVNSREDAVEGFTFFISIYA